MKYLYLFLLVSTTVFSQNYHYALDEKSGTSNADITAPTKPINLVASNITETTVTLSWTAATDNVGIADYRVYNNGILLLNSTEGSITSFTLTGLSPATDYNVTVRAVDAAANESSDSNNQKFTTEIAHTATRFIAFGASTMYSTFYFTDQIVALINDTYPDEKVTVFMEASPGQTIDSFKNGIDDRLAGYTNISGTQTFCIINLGTNDARTTLYENLTPSKIATKIANLNYIIDAIEAKGFTPILLDAHFSNFNKSTSFPNALGPAYEDESKGTKPYNDNIIKPVILKRTPEFAFDDGQSYMQPYTFFYNGHTNNPSYNSSDGVHPSSTGYAAFKRHFVNTICKYIFTGEAPTKIEKKGEVQSGTFPNNMPGEDDYLNAHFYPLAGASVAGLQNAIDTYGSVRLENGDYGDAAGTIYLGSNNKLYGFTSGTRVPYITILKGSTGVFIDGVMARRLNIESGASVTGCTFKNMINTDVILTNSSFENNTLINIKGRFLWDCSTSGYFRNNTIIKQWIQGGNPQNIFQGNTTTPSYGNLQIWVNHLTPTGHGNEYHNVQDVTIIGLDSEQWNFSNQSSKAMTYMRNVGDVKITDFGGGNGNSTVKTPPFDIQASKLSLLNSNINNSGTVNSTIRANTDAFLTNTKSRYTYEAGTGYHINLSDGISNYNNGLLTGLVNTLSIITNLKKSILSEEKKPIARPNLPTIPNPTGANWANDRIGKADQSAYIQSLVKANKIAELPEGIYYISSTIKLNHDEGIRGSGTGKTAIVGLTDDFPLITFEDQNTNKRWHISNITLQGGHTGLKIQPNKAGVSMMVTGIAMHDVVFRDQTYGIHLNKFFGLDNNFFENVNFINCNIGLFQERNPASNTTQADIMYMDKNVFYRSQIINCGVGFSNIAGRPNNLNAWVDCVFDGNGIAADLYYNNYPIFANCDFKNHTGDYVVGRQAKTSFYSCNFTNNATKSTFKMVGLNMEGCTVSDNTNLLTQVNNNTTSAYILNSTVKGNLGHYTHGVISNSLVGNLNKLLININSGVFSTILSDTPTPFPQYLVKP